MNNKQLNFIWFDLVFLSFLAAVSEWMGHGLLKVWNSSFYFSFSIAIGIIATIRWGIWGTVVAMAGGLPELFFSGMPWISGFFFCVAANSFLGLPILLYGQRDRNRIAGEPFLLVLYILLCHGCLSLGKGIVIFFLTGEMTGAVDYFGATFLILVINIIVCLVLKTREGLLCDMRSYFEQREGEEDER